MFITELILDTKALTYDPSEDKFQVSLQILYSGGWVVFILHVFHPLAIQAGELFGDLRPDKTNGDGGSYAHR